MSVAQETVGELHCRSWTDARRFPLVVGRIGGFRLPFVLSLHQVAVLLTTFGGLVATRTVWAVLGPVGNVLIVIGIPAVLTYAVRHLRIEGRSPVRSLLGLASLAATPRHGVNIDGPVRTPRTRYAPTARVLVSGPGPAETPRRSRCPRERRMP